MQYLPFRVLSVPVSAYRSRGPPRSIIIRHDPCYGLDLSPSPSHHSSFLLYISSLASSLSSSSFVLGYQNSTLNESFLSVCLPSTQEAQCVFLIISVHRRKVMIKFAAVLFHSLEAPCSDFCTEICHPKVLQWFSSVHPGKTRCSPQLSFLSHFFFSVYYLSASSNLNSPTFIV